MININWFKLSPTQRKFFWLTVAGLLVLIFSSHLVGWLKSNEQMIYNGARMFRGRDFFGYLSFMQQARDGAWGFYNLYSLLPQQPYFFHPLWLILGKIGLITNWSNLAVYLLAQAALIVVFLFGWWNFINWLTVDLKLARFLFVFSLLSGGVSYTWLHEVNTFLILYVSPLFALALSCFLLIMWSSLLTLEQGFSWRVSLWGGLAGLGLMLNHFYDIISLIFILIIIGLVAMIRNGRWLDYGKHLLCLAVMIAPAILYYGYIFTMIPGLAEWAKENITLSPNLWFYLKSYGLLLFLSLGGSWLVIKKLEYRQGKWFWLVIWLITQLVILYSPVMFNRRFALGSSLPMGLLAAVVCWQLWLKSFKVKLVKTAAIIILVLGLVLGNYFMIAADFLTIFVFSFDQQQAFAWVKNNSPKDSRILANALAWDTIISGMTGKFSLVAISYSTSLGFNDWRFKIVKYFYQNNNNQEQKIKLLKKLNLKYVWFGPFEKRLGTFDPDQLPGLKLVFSSGLEKIYQLE